MKGEQCLKGQNYYMYKYFLEVNFCHNGKHVNKSGNCKKFDVLFDLIRSNNKLVFKKSKFVYTHHVQTLKEDNKERGLIIHINKIKSAPAWKLPSL